MPLSRAESAHLCRRVGFGGTIGEITHFSDREPEDAVEELLAVNPDPAVGPPGLNNPEWWQVSNDMRLWWVDRMIDARWVNRTADRPSPLEEKMTLFWHSHFATGISKVEDASTMFKQNNIFRNRGRGSFATLLDKVTHNGALLRYLDNDSNMASNPQENFARELMELYTIGPENFTESDVIEMTRAWTGHGIVGWVGEWDATYEWHPEYHDGGMKVLFGLPAQRWNGHGTLSIFTEGVRQTATAHFIATKLWRYFVNDHPTESEIDTVVDAFLPTLDITAALRAILLHPTFWAPETEFALVRSPIEIIVHVLRELRLNADDGNFIWQLDSLGHLLYEPPSVAGWGTGDYWVGTGAVWSKAQWLISLGWNQDAWSQFEPFIEHETGLEAADFVLDLLNVPKPSQETRDALASLWTAHRASDSWAAKHNAMILSAMCPEMQAG